MSKREFWIFISDEMPEEKQQELATNIETAYPKLNHFKIHKNLYAIEAEQLSSDVVASVGIGRENNLIGLVIPVPRVRGYFNNDYIEWVEGNDCCIL